MIITHLFSTGKFIHTDTHQSNTHLRLNNVKLIGTPSQSRREKLGSNPSALTLYQDNIR